MLVLPTMMMYVRPLFRLDDCHSTTKGPRMPLKDNIQDKTGIYHLGFNRYSFLGILLPLLFVVIVGGGLAFLVTQM
jgi:hypothetical protein